jgi:hypothetical protein
MRLLMYMLVLSCVTAGPAIASPYWIAYEGNDFPENEGWRRVTFAGGAQRHLDDGLFVIDSRQSISIADFYEMRRDGKLDPEPGETFLMQWRMRIREVNGFTDPTIGVFADTSFAVFFEFSAEQIISPLENVSLPLASGVFHSFDFRSGDMLNYDLYIDESLAFEGVFVDVVTTSLMGWGDGVQGSSSLVDWDYVRFGVIPEPNSALVWLAAGLVLLRWKRRIQMRQGAICVVLAALPLVAHGEPNNVISQTNGNLIEGTDYQINQFARSVTILRGNDTQIFEFRARLLDNGEYVGPGDINLVAVGPGASGLVRVSLVDEEHPVGVRDLKQMDLTGPNVTGILEYASIAEDVGEDGPVVINQAVGPVDVGGNWVNTLQADEITAPIVIDGALNGTIQTGSLGDFVANARLQLVSHAGTLEIQQPYSGTILIYGGMNGAIELSNDMSGEISGNVLGDFSGASPRAGRKALLLRAGLRPRRAGRCKQKEAESCAC